MGFGEDLRIIPSCFKTDSFGDMSAVSERDTEVSQSLNHDFVLTLMPRSSLFRILNTFSNNVVMSLENAV